MTAQSAINASTHTRQSESNWFGRGRFSVVGGSRLRAGPEFIAAGSLYESVVTGFCPSGRGPSTPLGAGSAPPPHNSVTSHNSVGGYPAGYTAARYFAINLKNSRHRVRPGKSLRLLVAALFHALAQRRIQQHALQSSANLKHV